MTTQFTLAYEGAADQVQSTFTEQMALNITDTHKDVLLEFLAKTNIGSKMFPLTVDGYMIRIPAYGSVAAAYHTPGLQVEGMSDAGNANVRTGALNDRLVAHIAQDEYDTKQRASIQFAPARKRALGAAIADVTERQAAIMTILASRASATVSGGPVGGFVGEPGSSLSAASLIASLWAARTAFDLNHVPDNDRWCALSPSLYNLLVSQLPYLSDRNLGNDGSMVGMIRVPDVAGIQIIKSTYLPTTNITSATTGQRNTYTGDFRQTIGIVFQKEAACKLTPMTQLSMGGNGDAQITSNEQPGSPLGVRTEQIRPAFTELTIASLIDGNCVMRPEAAIEIRDTAL